MMNELFELSVTEANLEHIHGIGKPRNASQRSRLIILNSYSMMIERMYLTERRLCGNILFLHFSLSVFYQTGKCLFLFVIIILL